VSGKIKVSRKELDLVQEASDRIARRSGKRFVLDYARIEIVEDDHSRVDTEIARDSK
jgi:hypothetical protein